MTAASRARSAVWLALAYAVLAARSAPMPLTTRSPVIRSVAVLVAAARVVCSASARPTSGRASSREAPITIGTPASTAAASTGEAANSTAAPATSAAAELAARAYTVTTWAVRSASELANPMSSPGRPGAPPAGSSTRAETWTRTSRPARSCARSLSQKPIPPQLASTTKTATRTASQRNSADPSPVPTARSSAAPTTTGTAASES